MSTPNGWDGTTKDQKNSFSIFLGKLAGQLIFIIFVVFLLGVLARTVKFLVGAFV